MGYYDYGSYVRVVEGDPDAVAPNQYAFAAHHAKYSNYVQELRPAAVVPFIHGFTMPTEENDSETNACFKQVLLRPHHCRGRAHCRTVSFAAEFCEECEELRRELDEFGDPVVNENGAPRLKRVRTLSYVRPWRRFEATQLALAETADQRLDVSRKLPVMQDVTCLRQWWLPDAMRSSLVHELLLPLFTGQCRHATDAGLDGVWCRRSVPGGDSEQGPHAKLDTRSCYRLRFSSEIVWHILRYQGLVARDDGSLIGIANTEEELARLTLSIGGGADLPYKPWRA